MYLKALFRSRVLIDFLSQTMVEIFENLLAIKTFYFLPHSKQTEFFESQTRGNEKRI